MQKGRNKNLLVMQLENTIATCLGIKGGPKLQRKAIVAQGREWPHHLVEMVAQYKTKRKMATVEGDLRQELEGAMSF
jgi:hypothetical protein